MDTEITSFRSIDTNDCTLSLNRTELAEKGILPQLKCECECGKQISNLLVIILPKDLQATCY